MNVSAISNHSSANAVASLQYATADKAAMRRSKDAAETPAEIKKVAGQFEAIILRQLLAPSIEPLLAGSMGGGAVGGGGGVYGYMLTDTLAENLSKGGGLGLARMMEKQLSRSVATPPVTAGAVQKSLTIESKS